MGNDIDILAIKKRAVNGGSNRVVSEFAPRPPNPVGNPPVVSLQLRWSLPSATGATDQIQTLPSKSSIVFPAIEIVK